LCIENIACSIQVHEPKFYTHKAVRTARKTTKRKAGMKPAECIVEVVGGSHTATTRYSNQPKEQQDEY
jgi:hypothetical protein